MQRRLIGTLFSLLTLVLPAAAMAEWGLVDRSIAESIDRLSRDGLRVYYSTDLVRTSMKVLAEPSAQNPIDALTQILSPHGLMLRAGFNESWLVVRQPPPSPRVQAAALQATGAARSASEGTNAMPVEKVVVSASRYEIRGMNTTSLHQITDRDLRFSPDIGDDAIRVAARLPGMASNGFSALSNIRGGETGEALLRLDGLRLYDPFHLRDFQGIFSVIDPRIVGSMDVYTGAYPVKFGNRMSGVIDVETISPPDDLHHEIGISFFNSSILSAGKFLEDRGGWVASARRSNIDVLYDRFSEQPERPQYTDLFAKLRVDLTERISISGNLLRATDRIELADDVDREERAWARQTDSYGWIKLEHRLGGQLRGATLLASTDVTSLRSGTSEKSGISSGSLTDSRSFSLDTLQSEWTRLIGARFLLDFGGDISNFNSRYDYEDDVEFDLLFDVAGAPSETSRSRNISSHPHGRQYSLFATLRFDMNERLATELGYRWSEQKIGTTTSRTREPRIGLRYAISETTRLRASAGRFSQPQGINELQVNDGVSDFFGPQQADHFVLGMDRRLASGPTLRIEAYKKTMSDLRPRFENLLNSRVLLPELKPDRIRIAPESAEALGMEISLDGESGLFDWWGSVGWARVEDEFADGNVPRSWDQTYTLNAGLLWELDDWSFSTGIVYRSGWPTTPVVLDPTASFPTASAASRNTDRLGVYASIDVRVSRDIRFDQSDLNVFLELTNLTGRSNTCCIEYEVGDEEDLGLLVLDERAYLPTVPSLGFTWTF